jgi:mono/diheme cytochrome c family protein
VRASRTLSRHRGSGKQLPEEVLQLPAIKVIALARLPELLLSLSMPASSEAGRSLFTACSHYHGAEGIGRGIGGAAPSIRHYEGGQEKFLHIVQNGKKGTPMGAFKSILTQEEILSIYQYLTSLPRQ